MVRKIRHWFFVRKERKLLRMIDRGKLSFEQAQCRGLLPPLVGSYWLLQYYVNQGTMLETR